MPNIKSAKKRVLVNDKKTEQNKAIRSAVKTEIKKIELLIKENKFEEAKAGLSNLYKVIDSATSKNIFHANNASNKKSKIAKKIDAGLKATAVEVKEEVIAEVKEEVKEEVAPVKKTTRKASTKKAEKAE